MFSIGAHGSTTNHLNCLRCVVEIEMISILPLGSIAVWDIFLTTSAVSLAALLAHIH